MTTDDARPDSPPAPDQPDPATGGVRPGADEALKRSIADWAAQLKEVEAARRREAGVRETNDAVDDLARLRAIGMSHAERTDREAAGLLTANEQNALARGTDPALKFVRVARAVRQAIVLQQELLGLRPVAGVRAGIAAPAPSAPAPSNTMPAPSPSRRSATAPSPGSSPGQALSRDGGEGLSDDLVDRERSDLSERCDLYDYDDRVFPEAIATVRETLGVVPDLQRAAAAAAAPTADVTGGLKARVRLNASASAAGANARGRGPP